MKKPIIALKNGTDVCRLLMSLIMSLTVFALLYLPEDSITVFSDGVDNGIKGLFSLVKAIL